MSVSKTNKWHYFIRTRRSYLSAVILQQGPGDDGVEHDKDHEWQEVEKHCNHHVVKCAPKVVDVGLTHGPSNSVNEPRATHMLQPQYRPTDEREILNFLYVGTVKATK